MNDKSNEKNLLQKIGLVMFSLALLIFTASLMMSRFVLDEDALREQLLLSVPDEIRQEYGIDETYYFHIAEQELTSLRGKAYSSSFAFAGALTQGMKNVQAAIKRDLEEKGITSKNSAYWKLVLQDYRVTSLVFPVTKASSTGFLPRNHWLLFFGSIVLGILGALIYQLPKLRRLPGIKNDHIYHSSMHYRGWLGIAAGVYLIGFYVLLYFYPAYLVNWIILVDPISRALNGGPADQWFLYGFLYTLAILVMGVRMLIKYRHSNYHIIRTFSVIFFQTAFAFLIPQLLALLQQPSLDLKNIWPLDYSFFFSYRIDQLMASGKLGLFMLFWGIALILIGVPVFTYFYGKRWYCSWVCGCGGLAETLGDPYRQLSDKSLPGWQIERWMIHAVLVFAVVMTGITLYANFSGSGPTFKISRWLVLGLIWGFGAVLLLAHRRSYPAVPRRKLLTIVGVIGAVATIGLVVGFYTKDSALLSISTYQVQKWYGFYIGAGFSGVIGTGFYPLMGNRVWCRFGCPLAAYLGIVQRFKSRFRITTNGGQCISCGNCSTYCEMGIDVRWYAQRGQDVVRASCVGCGVCAAVCPRGVLRLENSAVDVDVRAQEARALLITKDSVELLR